MTDDVRWVPEDASALTPEPQLVEVEGPRDGQLEVLILYVGAFVSPALLASGGGSKGAGGTLIGLLAGLALSGFCILATRLYRHGLYVSQEGAQLWPWVQPGPTIPWADIAEFRLERVRVDLGMGEQDQVAVVTRAGEVHRCRRLSRYSDFESRRVPAAPAKARLRSLPALVEQLNRIRHEMIAT